MVAFGAFVEILEGVEGLVHISELAAHHVENPREVVQPGDVVRVKILEIDSERRRLSLSIKRVEGQILPSEIRAREAGLPAPGEAAAAAASAGDLDDVADLGLSEDVFAGEGDPDAAVAVDDAAAVEAELPVEAADDATEVEADAEAPAADAEPEASAEAAEAPAEEAAAEEPAAAEVEAADEPADEASDEPAADEAPASEDDAAPAADAEPEA